MNNVSFSPLCCTDVSNATEVIVEAFSKNGESNPRYTREPVTDILLRSLGSNSTTSFIVAKIGDKVIGVGGYGQAPFASNTWFLFMLAVDKVYRKLGIGTSIIKQRVELILSQADKGRILVSTFHPARFEKLRFVEVDKDMDTNATLMIRKI